MTPITFLLTDIVQILKLAVEISVPVAVVIAAGIWIVFKRIKAR